MFSTRVAQGRHTVCIWAKNIYSGRDTQLSCRTRTLNYGPRGAVEYVRTAHGGLSIKGWAADGDNTHTPLSVVVTVDKTQTVLPADASDSTVPSWAGSTHGYSAFLATSQGSHQVCVLAKNIGYGSDSGLGCRTITLDEGPTGALTIIGQRAGALQVQGWAYDVDSPSSALRVTVTIDGKSSDLTANARRTDVAAAHPNAGPNHGFDLSRRLAEGSHQVRVVAHNIDLGRDRVLADRAVTLNFTPSASLVSLTVKSNAVFAQGWAIDPDTSSPIQVRLSVNGTTTTTVTASRPGPQNAPYKGRNFGQWLTLRSGTYNICATALNALYGTRNSSASCRTVTLALSPLGTFESATRDAASHGIRSHGLGARPRHDQPPDDRRVDRRQAGARPAGRRPRVRTSPAPTPASAPPTASRRC